MVLLLLSKTGKCFLFYCGRPPFFRFPARAAEILALLEQGGGSISSIVSAVDAARLLADEGWTVPTWRDLFYGLEPDQAAADAPDAEAGEGRHSWQFDPIFSKNVFFFQKLRRTRQDPVRPRAGARDRPRSWTPFADQRSQVHENLQTFVRGIS